jgi:peptidoglycan hydrolase-like protein with peptidoglycan-binding domain
VSDRQASQKNKGLQNRQSRIKSPAVTASTGAESAFAPNVLLTAAGMAGLRACSCNRPLRQALVLRMQQQYGNQAVQRLLAGRDGRLQRNPEDGDAEDPYEETAPKELKNARFTGNTVLLSILQGDKELSKSNNGAPVRVVQQALFQMSYPLPRFRVDGKIGSETHEAIRRFRSDQHLEPGNQFDSAAMEALDKAAPPPGQGARKMIDYARLLADGKLTFTLGIGYDEKGWHEDAVPDMVNFILDQEFTGVMQPNGIGLFTKQQGFIYQDMEAGQSVSKKVRIEIKLITPSTEGAKSQFAKGLSESDITIYSGHARYGTGPDFDPGKSAAENFTIGVGSALHKAGKLKKPPGEDASWYSGHRKAKRHLDKRKNDLEQMTAGGQLDPEKYQVWFFNACTTLHYLDELRSEEIMGEKGRESLDIFGTLRPSYLDDEIKAAKAFILSVLRVDNLDELMASLHNANEEWAGEAEAAGYDKEQDFYFHEGFGDNPVEVGSP